MKFTRITQWQMQIPHLHFCQITKGEKPELHLPTWTRLLWVVEDTMSHTLGPHNINLCTVPAIGYKTTTDVDDTLFQQCRNTGNCTNKNNKKFSCTITVATMHFYLLYNWIIFFICHARIKQSFFLAYSLAQPERKQECHMNNFICVTYHMQPRVLFKLTWLFSVIICLVCILKECKCLHEQVPNTQYEGHKIIEMSKCLKNR